MLQTQTSNTLLQKARLDNKNSSKLFNLILVIAILLATLLAFQPSAFAGNYTKADPLSLAQSAYDQAKTEANYAAGKYQEANHNLAEVNDKVATVTSQIEITETSLGGIKEKVAERAVSAYISSSDKNYTNQQQDVIDKTRRTQLLDTVTEVDNSKISLFVSLKEDLSVQQSELAALQSDAKETLGILADQKKELDKKLANASQAKKDVEAKIAKDKKAQEAAQKAAQKVTSAKSSSSTSPGTVINPGNLGQVCPIAGSLAYSNDWGDSRAGGGRTHKGIDLFNPRGTPNVAMVSGRLYFQNGGAGGTAAIIQGDNGYSYYYAHLNNTVGPPRRVSVGEVIGNTGNSGNAKGGATHTHFEIWDRSYAKQKVFATISSLC